MPKTINYDFSNIEDALWAIKKTNSPVALNKLKKEVNKFFSDSTCTEIIYTKNTDKFFFGMCVYPIITSHKTNQSAENTSINILLSDDDIRIKEYCVEIDSQLFSPKFDFSKRQLTAILLHEIGHMVNDAIPIKRLRKAIDKYQIDTHKPLNLSQYIKQDWLLKFGLADSLRKITSLFCNEEVAADEFVHLCGYGEDLEIVLHKLKHNISSMNNLPNNKLIVLGWTLRLYTDLYVNRIPAIRHLNKASRMTGSELEKRAMVELRNRLEIIDREDADMSSGEEDLQESCIYEYGYLNINEGGGGLKNTISKLKYKGIKAFDEDYYEFFMRMRNVEDEDDALLLMRQINTRISILTEYIEDQGPDMEAPVKKQYFNMLDKYILLRDKLANKTTYRDKGFNMIINYPEITDCRK